MPPSIRVAIAEDQRLVREALAALLAREAGLELVGQAGTGREAIELCVAERPDVLVLDISLPEMDGINVTRQLRARLPALKVLALSVHAEAHYVREMLKAGAVGYLIKGSALVELVHAIRVVMGEGRYLSPELEHVRAADTARALSGREREVLALLAEGQRSAQIAATLGISAGTVEAHRRNIMRKLDLHSVAELTRYAVREGIITP